MRTVCACLTALVCMLSATDAPAFEHVFSAAANYYVPDPLSVCSGDFNGDGKIDLAVGQDIAVSILIGLGDGSFTAATPFSASCSPFSVCTGDFDQNGTIDLATANLGTNNASVLLGAGDGTFSAPVNYYTGESPREICTGDFNEDGHVDLVVANYGYYDFPGQPGTPPGNISILLNNGNGTFAPAINFDAGDRIGSVHVSDFNNDAHLDLVIVNHGYRTFPDNTLVTGSISILLGAGDGTFSPAGTYDEGLDPHKVSSGDFNEDGRVDLVVVNLNADNVSILIGSGTGLFIKLGDHAVGDCPNAVCVSDVDADGHDDLAVTNECCDEISILFGAGDFTLSPAVQYGAGENPVSICANDFNNDGCIDIAACARHSQALSILLGRGDGTLEAAPAYDVGEQPRDVCTGDFNEDGHADLAVCDYGWRYCSILMGSGDGAFESAIRSWKCGFATSVCAGDFNEDGHADLVFTSDYNNEIVMLPGYGDGTFAYPPLSCEIPGGPVSAGTSDFNQDGHMDLAVANWVSANIAVLLGVGDGSFSPMVYYETGSYPKRVLIGDFNEDGYADIAASKQYDDISILLNAGNGTFAQPVNYYACRVPDDIATGDFNEDGHVDIAVASRYDENITYTDNVSILLGAGDGTFASPSSCGLGHDATSICAGDFDGDTHVDLVVANRNIESVSVLRGSGNGAFTNVAVYGVYRRPYSICPGDFNEDNYPDLAVVNVSSNNVSILINRAENIVATLLHSFNCSHFAEGIAIDWRLSAASASMHFSICRESDGRGIFLPLGLEVVSTGILSYRCIDISCEPGARYRYRVDVTDGEESKILFVTGQVGMPAAGLALYQNYPNPFNPATTIFYSIPARERVTLDIFDTAGRHIVRLVDSERNAGTHSAQWSGRNESGRSVSSGVYLYRLTAGKQSITRKMVLLQ